MRLLAAGAQDAYLIPILMKKGRPGILLSVLTTRQRMQEAIGVIFRRPCLRGSCGGPEVRTAGGESLSCATCPNRKTKHAHDMS